MGPIRRSTLKKVSKSKKTGAAGSRQLTELDKTVPDILGRESANIGPVKVKNSDIVFGEDSLSQQLLPLTFYTIQPS